MNDLRNEYIKHRNFCIANKLPLIGLPEDPTEEQLIEWAVDTIQSKGQVITKLCGELVHAEQKLSTGY